MAYSSEPASRGFIPPRDDHERLIMRRAEELSRAAEGSGRVRWTSFLSDREQDLCVAAMNRVGCCCYGFEGGFEQAERKLLCIRPAGAYGEPPLCCVRLKSSQPGPGHRDLLGGALEAALDRAAVITDDCSALVLLRKTVYLTQGSYENIKITTAEDLPVAEAIWENRSEA